jgi:hypothetical protein
MRVVIGGSIYNDRRDNAVSERRVEADVNIG